MSSAPPFFFLNFQCTRIKTGSSSQSIRPCSWPYQLVLLHTNGFGSGGHERGMGMFGPAPPFPAEEKMAKTSNFWLIFLVFYFVLRCSLCWFQTNLPLAALPLRRWSSLAVSELQLSAATPLWLFTERQSLQSWIEFNCLRSAAVGKAARLSIYWLDAAYRLVIPLRQVTLAQLN